MSALASLGIGIVDREHGHVRLKRALAWADAAGLPGVSLEARSALAGRFGTQERERHTKIARKTIARLAVSIDDVAIREAFEAGADAEMELLDRGGIVQAVNPEGEQQEAWDTAAKPRDRQP